MCACVRACTRVWRSKGDSGSSLPLCLRQGLITAVYEVTGRTAISALDSEAPARPSHLHALTYHAGSSALLLNFEFL